MGQVAFSGNNPTIRNVGLLSRKAELAVPVGCIVDGTTIPADGYLLRGTLLVFNTANNKWHQFVHGTDTLVIDQIAIVQDDTKVTASTDCPVSAYREGFFNLADVLDANAASPQSMVLADVTGQAAVGVHLLPGLPGGTATELRLK